MIFVRLLHILFEPLPPCTALRIEWARCKARALRWLEELELVSEEMRRAIEFCDYEESWWAGRIGLRTDVDAELGEGLKSYAHERVLAEREFKAKWEGQWSVVLSRAKAFLDNRDHPSTDADGISPDPLPAVEIDVPDPIERLNDM